MSDSGMVSMLKASRVLFLTNKELGKLCGVSVRTVQRWYTNASAPMGWHFHAVARAVYPHDPELARQLAAHGATTPEALGLAPTKAANAGPPPAVLKLHADAIVYAAAEALDVSPRAMRPAVAAAFARALEVGADINAVTRHLSAETKAHAALAAKPEPTKRG